MDFVRAFYADKQGIRPENRTEPRLREETTGTDETETETDETETTDTETTVTTPVVEGDPAAGKEVFLGASACGSCHTLAAAGTAGTIGPNLDDAFASDREQGFEESSIQQVVAGQIKFPVETPSTGAPDWFTG